MKSIKFWIVVCINLLVTLIVSILLVFLYKEFQNTLDKRVLLQLNSIKSLKSVQIEDYLNQEWQTFIESPTTPDHAIDNHNFKSISNSIDTLCLMAQLSDRPAGMGIYDVSACTTEKESKLAFVKKLENKGYKIKIIDTEKIQEILLERTGMGKSGETYLVGRDLKMKSISRFFPDKSPHKMLVNTTGVQQAFAGKDSSSILNDYRGVPVYSSYKRLNIANLDWVILSEIDVAEVTVPLQKMRNKLLFISAMVILFAIVLSLFISTILSNPLLMMRDMLHSMSQGNYSFSVKETHPAKEIKEMFIALNKLKKSINEAILFSNEIGEKNLHADYRLSSDNDTLGKSLILMQKKLIDYEAISTKNRLLAKQSIIRGEENERERLSRELHDGLGPLLTSLKMAISSSKLNHTEKEKIIDTLDSTIAEIRRMTYDLMPPALADFGVGKALLNFVESIKKSSGIAIVYEYETKERTAAIDTEIDICLFRVCQELINNTLKHANASKIVLSLTEFDNKYALYYADNGSGFNINEVKTGLGLRNIRERVEVFEGYLDITSGPKGTVVEVEIPLKE